MTGQLELFVDVGFLLAAAASRITGTGCRQTVNVDTPGLATALTGWAASRDGQPPRRLCWYDAVPDRAGLAGYQHKTVAYADRVIVRLGRIRPDGCQKGVDMRIGLDLADTARAGIVDTVYLLAGDDDLTEAVVDAQQAGLRVVMAGFADTTAASGLFDVADNLALHADGIAILPDLADTITAARNAGATVSPPAGLTATLDRSPDRDGRNGHNPETPETVGARIADKVGHDTTDNENVDHILAQEPYLPAHVDSDLLREYSHRIGNGDHIPDHVRRQLRHAFWCRFHQNAGQTEPERAAYRHG